MFFVLVQCLGLGPVLVNEVQIPLIISRAALWPDKKAPCTVATLMIALIKDKKKIRVQFSKSIIL